MPVEVSLEPAWIVERTSPCSRTTTCRNSTRAASLPAPGRPTRHRPARWSSSASVAACGSRRSIPPVLILAAAFAILTFRVRTTDWRGWTFPQQAPPQATSEPATVAEEEPGESAAPTDPEVESVAAVFPTAEESVTPTLPERPVVDTPSPRPEDLPNALTADLYRPMLPEAEPEAPAGQVAAVAVPEGDADPREVWADIQREAQAHADNRERLADLKPLLLERDERRADGKKAEQRQRDQEQRTDFQQALRQALQDEGAASADAIRRLANLPLNEPIPRSASAVKRARELAVSFVERRNWIVHARGRGVADPEILADLALAHLVNSVARTGPRSEDDALIRAGRELLGVPADATAPPEPVPPRASVSAPSPRRSSRYGFSQRR